MGTKVKPTVEVRGMPQTHGEVMIVEPPPLEREAEVVNPMEMLRDAFSKGVDLAQLDKLLDLQRRWEGMKAERAFTHAMAQFKANAPHIMKDKRAGFDSKRTGDKVGYSYATLANVCDEVVPALARFGLSHKWELHQDGQTIRVTCVLRHQLGHAESVSLAAGPDASGAKNSIQAIGSTVSYLQRYTLLAATGLAAGDQDDDGDAGDQPAPQRSQFQPQQPDKVNWADWSARFLDRIRACKSLDEVTKVEVDNGEKLATLRADDAAVYEATASGVAKIRAGFSVRFSVVDCDHVSKLYYGAAVDHAADHISKVFDEAGRRGVEQLEAMWEANAVTIAQIRSYGRQDLADAVADAYREAGSAATSARAPAQPSPAQPDQELPPAAASKPEVKAKAEEPKAEAEEQPTKLLSPLRPRKKGEKGMSEAEWIRFSSGLLKLIKGAAPEAAQALAVTYDSEIKYLRGFLPVEAEAIDLALDAKRL